MQVESVADMNDDALILFAHGARDPEWAGPLTRLEARVRALAPQKTVRKAFLEFMAPSLAQVIDALVQEGAVRITVLPVFLAQGGHLKHDVPALLAHARERYPQCAFTLSLPVGEVPDVIDAMAVHALTV